MDNLFNNKTLILAVEKWGKSIKEKIPLPPSILVGFKEFNRD